MRMTESPELSGTVVGAILGPGTSYREDWFDSWSWVVLYPLHYLSRAVSPPVSHLGLHSDTRKARSDCHLICRTIKLELGTISRGVGPIGTDRRRDHSTTESEQICCDQGAI